MATVTASVVTMNDVLLLLVVFLSPAAALWARRRNATVAALGPVVVCYGVGLLVANIGFSVDQDLAMQVSGASIAISIPLLLFSVDVLAWLRLARSTVISFALCLASVMIASAGCRYVFDQHVERPADIAGMLVGIYSGGTPNMAAIGQALEVEPALFVMVNAADIVLGGIWLLILLSFGPRVLGRFLPPFAALASDQPAFEGDEQALPPWREVGRGLGLSLLCVLVGVLAGEVVSAEASDAVTILGLTSAAVAASSNSRVRAIGGTYAVGQYGLLAFCVAVGSLANLAELVSASPAVLAFTAATMVGAIVLHVASCALLGIDRDTVIITSTAAIFGPAFVAPVADRLQNREIVLSGVTTGLVGYAVGNYLGLGLCWLLR